MTEPAGTSMTARYPHREPFVIGGRSFTAEHIVETLRPYVTERRRDTIDRVLAERTYTIVPVTESLYDRGNVSAVIRSAEAMGYQGVHVIETSKKFKEATRVTQGAEKWLDVTRWQSTEACLAQLRGAGYRILAAHMRGAQPLDAIEFAEPAAVFFGKEREGLSELVLDAADARVRVPMSGFTRSFNISVAAAITLYHIRNWRQTRLGGHGDLTDEEQGALRAVYYLRCVKFAEHVLLETPEAKN